MRSCATDRKCLEPLVAAATQCHVHHSVTIIDRVDLVQDPNDFLAAMRKWMLPRKALAEGEGHSSAEKLAQYSVPDELPDLLATLGTIRKRFAALNSNPAAGANGKKK